MLCNTHVNVVYLFEMHVLYISRMDIFTVGVRIGNRLYNALLTNEQIHELETQAVKSVAYQQLLQDPVFVRLGEDLQELQSQVKVLY